jgi:hypothetical protein
MAESNTHIRLVTALVSWIAAEYFCGQRGALLIDSPDSTVIAKPIEIGGFVPDVLGHGLPGGAIVIGEAKTARDVENQHTRRQLEAFLRYCAVIPGSLFVFAVPWHMTRYAQALLKQVGQASGCARVSTVVLEQLEG